MKNGTSATPCTCALKPLIFEFSDSASTYLPPGEQFDQRVSGAEHGGTELLLPDALASALPALRLLLSAFLHGVLRPAVCTFPSLGILVLLPRSLFLLRRCDGQPLESQAHLVKGLAQPLHDVEAVDDDGGIGEHSRTMAYMESLKSIVTSLTFSRSARGIIFRILETTSALVPLTTAMTVPLPPCPALLENIV